MIRSQLAVKLAMDGHVLPLETFVNEEKGYFDLKAFGRPVYEADVLMHTLRQFYPANFADQIKAPYLLTPVERLMEKQAAETMAHMGILAERVCKECEFPVKFKDLDQFLHHLYARHNYNMIRQLHAAFSKEHIVTRPLRLSDVSR